MTRRASIAPRSALIPALGIALVACTGRNAGLTPIGDAAAVAVPDAGGVGPIVAADAGVAAPDAAAGADAGTDGAATASPTFDQVKAWVDAYRAAHPGNGGKDRDINDKSDAQLAADPAAQRLLALCGKDQRPVIPLLAWEYGGADHQWIDPQASALVYCVYTPVKTPSASWRYDAARDHVTADVYVRFPDQNPCKTQQGAAQVLACLGDPSNAEILVDTASIHDGADVGLVLANASTLLRLVLPDGSKVNLLENL
jgi:hypothetical protein